MIREEPCAIPHRVDDLDRARCVDCAWDVDFQVSIVPSRLGLILQPLPAFGDTLHVKEKCVVGGARPRILDGNGAVNSVPFTYEHQRDALVNGGRAIVLDGDRVFEIRDTPGTGEKRSGDGENPQYGKPDLDERSSAEAARRASV